MSLGALLPASRASLLCTTIALAGALAVTATAQQGPGPLPPGPGVVIGQIVHPDDPARAAGVPIVLYALSAGGSAGVGDTTSNERGEFVFEGVSNDPEMAYLVGARYRDIPFFGPRVLFAEGQTETRVIVDINDPTSDASGVGVHEVLVQLEWVAGRLAVQEIHRVRSAGSTVVMVQEADRESTPAPFEARLPAGASDFVAQASGFNDQIDEQDGRIRFWGPLYPSGQDLRFQYTLPLAGQQTPIALTLPMGADGLSVLTRISGPRVVGAGPLSEPEEIELEGDRFHVRRLANVAAGREIRFRIALPPTSADASRIGIARTDAWIEYDDTQLSVNLQTRLVVDGDERVASATGEPLLSIPLPDGAEVLELTGLAEVLGAREIDGSIALYGPFLPGESPVGVRFRLSPAPDGIVFDLQFPMEVKLLNLLVADTGIAIDSDRLHRRRPFRQGTRIYLHREAFHLRADETVTVGLRPLQDPRLGGRTSLGLGVAGLLASAFFLARPLVRRRAAPLDPEETALSIQREALYEAIRDLDHDLETGKVAESDHHEMRQALRTRAVDLLRRERGGDAAPDAAPDAPHSAVCPGCGTATQARWEFCPDCGARLGGSG